MKSVHIALLLVTLVAGTSINAKRIESKSIIPGRMMESSTTSSFSQLVEFVKTAANVWTAANMLNEEFTNDLIKRAEAISLDGFEFEVLLDMARDYHAPFGSDDAKNKEIINNYKGRKEDIMKDYRKVTPLSPQPAPEPVQ